MAAQNFELEPNETLIDTWALNYIPPNGGKYNGKCRVTNLHIIFEALIDYSASAILFKGMFLKPGSLLIIKKEDIKSIDTKKIFLSKQIILTLTDGEKHTLDRGAMGIDDILKAINNN
jgi:hypothetical protein